MMHANNIAIIVLVILKVAAEKNDNCIFPINFLNTDIWLNILCTRFKLHLLILHVIMEGTASSIWVLFFFILSNEKDNVLKKSL